MYHETSIRFLGQNLVATALDMAADEAAVKGTKDSQAYSVSEIFGLKDSAPMDWINIAGPVVAPGRDNSAYSVPVASQINNLSGLQRLGRDVITWQPGDFTDQISSPAQPASGVGLLLLAGIALMFLVHKTH